VLALDGFEPGVPAKIIHWLGARASGVDLGVLVTASPVLVATVHAAQLLLSPGVFVPASTRSEAYAAAAAVAGRRARVSSELTRAGVVPVERNKRSA
jgi:hypothetical protein